MTTVVIVDAAEKQLSEFVEWWAEHREANPLMVMQEFNRCVSILEDGAARSCRSTRMQPRS